MLRVASAYEKTSRGSRRRSGAALSRSRGWFGGTSLASAIVLSGCTGATQVTPVRSVEAPGLVEPSVEPEPATHAEEARIALASDESLAASEYEMLGLPEVERPWSPADYGTAGSVLSELGSRNRLPRANSQRSGPVFSRLTAIENLAGLRVSSHPVGARLDEAQRYLNAIAPIVALYHQPAPDGGGFPTEQVELVALLLELVDQVQELARQQLTASSEGDRPREAERHARVAALSASFIQGALTMLAEADKYPASDRRRLVEQVEMYLPRFWPNLALASKSHLKSRLAELLKLSTSDSIMQKLAALDSRLDMANEASGAK